MTNMTRRTASQRMRSMALVATMMTVLSASTAHASSIPNDPQKLRVMLSQVAKAGDLNTMSALLRDGVDLNLQDADGEPALITATLAGQTDMVRLLLGHHADVMSRSQKGMTALHAAAYVGDVVIVKLLIANGAAIDDQANIAGITPLHAASEEDHLAVVKVLVAAGADPKRVEVNGYTAGSRAGWREHWEIVRFLLRSGDTCQPEDLAGAWLRDKCTHLDLSVSN